MAEAMRPNTNQLKINLTTYQVNPSVLMAEKIQKSNVREIVELNMVQKGMLYHYLKDANENVYNVQLSFSIKGDLNIELLKTAFGIVQSKNEALRSVFRWEKLSKPVQIILKECPVDFFYNDISDEQAESAEASIKQLGEKDKNDRFDLTKMPIRIRVIKSGPKAYTLNISNHHILFDGWSTGIFLKELLSCYNQLNARQEPIFSPKASYRKVQEALRKSATTEESVQYWKDYLEGHEVAPLLSYGSTSSKQVKNRIFSTPSTKFKAYARQHKVTQASVIYAAYGLLLQQYTAASEVIFGTSVSSRDATIEGVNDVVGNFFNTIPLRIKDLASKTLSEVVKEVHQGLIERNSYNSTSLSDIKESLDFNIDNLYDTVLGVENYPLDEAAIKGNGSLEVNLKSVYENTNFPVAITVFIKDTLEVNFMYKEGLVSEEYIEFMARNFIAVLNRILDHGSQRVKSLSLSAQPEELALFEKINATTVDFAADTGIHELFEEQVAQSGDKTALEYNGQILSYTALNTRANHLAALLQTEPGNIVGILLERSPELIISILAILKAGCSYLPINDELPDDRISYILSDSQCSKVISSAKYESRLVGLNEANAAKPGFSVVNIDQLDLESKPEISQPLQKSANDLAYTIYTSGTTGKPKGVAIGHRSLVNYIQWAAKQYVQGEAVAFPLYTSISFDLTVTSIFTPLITGNKLVIYGQEEQSLIDKVIEDNKVNVIKLTPSHLKLVRENLKLKAGFKSNVKRFILGGEALETGLAKDIYDLFGGDIEIYNEYGPTEATVGCMIYQFDPAQQSLTVPIGVPIDNTKVFVLDEDQQIQPIGVTGQLYIAGEGLAQGYLNKEALTKEKFIPNPQASGELMYKSGDLARWLPNGDLEFLGRTDDQVKIRGFRIELGEVEASLQKHPLLKEVAVLVKGEGTDRFLVAYYVCEQELNNDDELKEVLESELPAYMIPSQFVRLDNMPVNANGKLDRKALPEPDTSSEVSYEAPANELEEGLVDIWSAVLKLEKEEISVTQTFMELGGHSLKIILMLNRVFKQYNVLIPVNDIFNHSSVRALAGYMQELQKADSSGLEKAPEKAHYQLSAAQKRLYFLYEFDKTSLAYNGITTLLLEGKVDVAKLEQVFGKLIARHEVLRSSFKLADEQPVQIIAPEVDFSMEQFQAATEEVETIIKAFTRPFELAKAPLLRVGLLQMAEEQYMLMVDIHHIISDGVSGQILIKEFMALYTGESLAQPEFQYKDFAEWQQAPAQQEAVEKQQEFWVSEFTEETPKLDLPTDFARPMIKNYQGSSVQFEISSEQTGLLKKIAERETTTLFTVLLSVYNVLLSKLTNQEDIVVGSPIAGRSHVDIENMLGMFVNTLPLRNRPKGELSFKDFLAEVKRKTLRCFDHQDYPYEKLVDVLNIDRDVSRNPLFDTMFAYQSFEEIALEIPGLKLKTYEQENSISKFDLTLYVHEADDQLALIFEYATELFQKETIERFTGYFENIVSAITADLEMKINEIDILANEEKSLLLNDFNNTQHNFDLSNTIVSAFEETARQNGQKTALVVADKSLSYAELNEKSNQLARKIRALGAGKEDIIGIMLSRSEALIIGIMGVLKAGCAYVPIDPDYPVNRIKYIASHSGLKILLSEPSLDGIREHLPANIQLLDVTDPALALEEKTNLAIDIAPSSLAYMIYTSGSTGQPKGVMVEHGNVINFIEGVGKRIDYGQDDAMLCLTTVSFDIFVLESLFPLLRGLKIVLASSEDQKSAHALMSLIRQQQVAAIQITPSHLKLLLSENESADFLEEVKVLMVGGEGFPDELLDKLKTRYSGKIYNMYGPTETTVWSTIRDLTDAGQVDIGTPIANTTIRILDSADNLQPVGVPGELFIGGMGVTRGYFEDVPQTFEKFITDPVTGEGGLYKTGDLVKWLPDGNIVYLGRIDNQVKINGFRIELGEIESQLLTHDQVNEAAVVAREKAGNKFLVAYYVSNEAMDTLSLRSHLAATLPGYMVPSFFVHLAELPLTPNGKLDRKALPDPEVSVSKDYQAPASTEEKALAEVWSQVLGVEQIGVTDNFFSVGGDSIKSIQIGSRLRSLGYDVTVQDIFLHQTIQQLAVNMRKLATDEIATAAEEPMQLLSLEKSDDDGQPLNPFNLTYKGLTITQLGELQKKYAIADIYPLSPMQEGMLFHSLVDGETGSYLGQVTCKVSGALNIEAIEQTMNLLMVRYEVLRTAFLHEGYEPPIQVVLKERKIDFVYENIRESCEAGNKDALIKALRLKERADGFDLSEDALMRLKVLQTKEEEHTFIWTHHHVLMDGWCMNIIVQEFEAIYAQLVKESPVYLPYTTPYSKYIQWLEERETTASTRYWQNYLEGYEGLTSLPVKAKSAGQPSAYRLRNHKVQVEGAQVQRWKKVAADCGVTPNTIFQLAWSVLLARYNHTSDIMFGAVVSGRSTEVNGIESMVGLFINTIPVRVKLNENVAVSDLLKDIQKDSLNSIDHQYHPLSEIKALKESESDLFDHILTFENVPTGQKTNSEADQAGRPFELEVEDSFIQTNYNLSVTVHTGDQYEIQFDYNANHYQKDTMAAIASQLQNVLHSLIQQPDILVKDLSLFSDNESLCIKEKYSSDLEVDFDGLTLQDRLTRSFVGYGQNTAIEYKGQKFAYHELATNTNKIAASIETLGLPTGSFIGVLCEDRYQMISAILAVLQTRMVFVPLDAGLPKARLLSVIEQAGVAHIITDLQPAAREHLNPESLHWLTLDDTIGELTATYKTQKDYALTDPIYAYFTSGSTGVPKGVVGINKALSHFVHWETTTFDIDSSFRFSQFTNPGFDAFLRDLFVPLCAGATLCIPDDDLLTSGQEMANWIETQKISLIHCVPSMFKLFRDQNPDTNQFDHLKFVLLAGEKILPGELEKWYGQYGDKIQLVNLYGTTETTLVKGYYLIQPEDTKKAFIPVWPMSGSQFMLLDKHLNLCPEGATGEIYIRTPYMTGGYLKRAALNKEFFIMNPFGKDRTDLIYRTGDLGKLHEAGTLEVLGRQDQQVKIRGVRIELDEIRKNVLQYPGVSDAVVITRSDEAEEVLIYAYMVITKAIDQNELRTHLSNILTQSMVPSHFITIDKIPLTPNGKIDKQALPEPGETESLADFDGPSNEIEQTLAEIWSAAVEMDQQEVSVTRTFFEMGGHSLKLLLFVNRVNKHFSIKISIRDLFNRQTIRDLSDLLTTLIHASSEPADSNELIEISL